MTKKIQKRDNDYYLDRLRSDHPAIYADLRTGKFKNPSEAFVAAGLRRRKSPLDQLRTAWSKASSAEQSAFRGEIGCTASTTTTTVSVAPSGLTVSHASAPGNVRLAAGKVHLPPALEAEVRRIIAHRRLKNGDVMREMGLNARDASLGMALQRGTLVQDELIVALETWVAAHATK
jgi:hypothetical protein